MLNIKILNACSNNRLVFKLNSQHLIKNSLNLHYLGRYNIWVALRSWLITHIRKPYVACFARIVKKSLQGVAPAGLLFPDAVTASIAWVFFVQLWGKVDFKYFCYQPVGFSVINPTFNSYYLFNLLAL